ncbi:MAG TPA: UPF0147 family protein [Candidatus Syntrophoarchaeum butanivorans]|uniref:UPF0147 protein ENG09_00030 n=1 Tax=Candidatus Syntropharchaeum butanivorans TaxID=1839936 RepID=A0A7C0X3D1_9EURY|nr:MAG: UPF0147 family protein [Candidatus Syntrophoarchaeum sp. WYZ-LMO15]HDM35627.1 UPF0147 family protein [Candidatus Syntrophoarchaeum butanivorans]HEC56951.1 UPF0147 family protein [Candidatus Syntrophoarchaeum butanivorans]
MTPGIEEDFAECIETLDRIINDNSVPRNIRRLADQVKTNLLESDDPIPQRAAFVISMLDEITNDPNIPLHARTLVWSLASQLEAISVREEVSS